MIVTDLSELGLVILSSAELAVLVKATVVQLGAIVMLLAMRNASASARYLVVAAAFGGLLLLPWATYFMPPIAVELQRSTRPTSAIIATSEPLSAQTDRAGELGTTRSSNAAPDVSESLTTADSVRFQPLHLLRALWLAGVVVFVAPILIALRRARSLRRTAMTWPPGDVVGRELANQAGIVRPVSVLRHEGVAVPMTCAFFRPVILLPWDASDWPETELRRALIHELEHVRRLDWVVQLLARCVCAAYWFHPLVWRCWRHLHFEAERACDDAVVRQTGAETYAAQLVRLAERISQHAVRPTLAMASPGALAASVRSVLDTRRRRERAGAVGARSGNSRVALRDRDCAIARRDG